MPRLYSSLAALLLTARTMSIFSLPTLVKSRQRYLYFRNQAPVHSLLDEILYSTNLGNIFVCRADSRLMLRHSCLLWGMGGIGKTQICLKFIEDMADNFTHVFWVDASSDESITMSLKGISSIPAAQAFGMDGSVQTTLQWILLGDTRL
ncbi:hypothetical protein BYT27DRAFT_6845617 [Phlegmacium glaucopus]|nr:hypothetical protein BYT27DRAFT_6845617 [Phlegmacium glaucopus]